MSQYMVTISPVGEDGSAVEPTSQMVVRVELSDGEPHIVELTVRAAAGADLAGGLLPSIDLERLAQAFTPHGAETVATVRPAPAGRAAPRAGRRRSGSDRSPSDRATTARATSDRAVSGEGASAEKAAAPDVSLARAYRRMPDPAELRKVYGSIGSIAGVAKHYEVPTHTAQGWIGRLRRLDMSAVSQ